MSKLNRCNFYKNFRDIDIRNHKIRKITIDDQNLFAETFGYSKEEAFIKTANLVRQYNKNKETPFYIETENKLVGEIFVFKIENNDNAIGINIDLYNNYENILMLVLLIKKFIILVKYIFKVKKIFFLCDKENDNIKEVYNTFYIEYLLDVKLEKFEKEKSLFKFDIYEE